MSETAKKKLQLWVEERHEDILTMRYRVEETLFSGESDFQHIDIVETVGFGKMLFNDSTAMISERDEFIYHEMIAHVPMFVHPAPRRVLLAGGVLAAIGSPSRAAYLASQLRGELQVETVARPVKAADEAADRPAAALEDEATLWRDAVILAEIMPSQGALSLMIDAPLNEGVPGLLRDPARLSPAPVPSGERPVTLPPVADRFAAGAM